MASMFLSTLLTLFSLLISSTSLTFATTTKHEANALLKWKASLDNQSQAILSSWTTSTSHCDWKGITCNNSSKSVSKIELQSFGLRGILPQPCQYEYRKQLVLWNYSPPNWQLVQCFLFVNGL